MWDDISTSKEIAEFLATADSKSIFEKYSISRKEVDKNLKTKSKSKNVNFKQLKDCINIHSKTPEFYKKINSIYWDELTDNERSKLSNISAMIQQKDDLTGDLILFEESLIHRIRINNPEIFDQISFTPNILIEDTLNYVIKKYNSCIDKSENLILTFEKIGNVAKAKEIKYNSVFIEIGKLLSSGNAPTTKQIYYASYYVSILN